MDIRDAGKYVFEKLKNFDINPDTVRNGIPGLNKVYSGLREYLTRIGGGEGPANISDKVSYLATVPAVANITNSTASPGHYGDEVLIYLALIPITIYGISKGMELFAEVMRKIIVEIESFFIDINEDTETLYLTGEIRPTMRRDGTTGYEWVDHSWRNWIPGSWCRPWEKEEKGKK